MLELGGICTFDETQRGVLGKGLEQGFDLSALRRVPNPQPYLEQNPLGYLYLHHIIAGDRQIFALFSSSKEQAYVIVLNRSRDVQGLPNLDKIYKDHLASRFEASEGQPWQETFEYQSSIHFKTIQVTTKRKAHLEVADVIKRLRNDESRPAILVVRAENQKLLAHDIPVLKDLPVLPLQADESDKQLPPLGWQTFVARRLIDHYLDLGTWVTHLVGMARYGDIPLCNLERDDPRFLIDIAYARRLQKEKVVLWWSEGPKPDHAGYEKDDVLGSLETVEMPSINNPGTYSSVCIDLEIKNLAISTVLSSSIINEAEGSDSVSFNPAAPTEDQPSDGSNVIYSDNAFASAGILVLREMVKAWWLEAEKGGYMADVMVQHLVRWVECPGSFLYDRALHYYVQMMSKKALQQLMSDFRRVGSHVVFASANRLLLQTTKAEVGNAYAYSQYILKTVHAKPIFQSLDLQIKEYWDYLAWYDEFNYGGKGCREVVEAENQTLDTIMCWHFATFLPPALQPVFNDWVVEFIELMHARKRPQQRPSSSGGDGQVQVESTPRMTQLPFRPLTQDTSETPTTVLAKSFIKPLTKEIAALLRRQQQEQLHTELAPDWMFPSLPGTNPDVAATLTNPALQLVKCLTQVLSLDKSINLEARLLRKELLRLFDIREFSAEAAFANPAASLWVRGLVCDDCTAVRDVDLCRDGEVIASMSASTAEDGAVVKGSLNLSCPSCRTPHDLSRLETRLAADVQALVLKWAGQDVKCGKCGRLQSETSCFMEHCACSGQWVPSLKREELVRKLKVYEQAAIWFGFGVLGSCVKDVVEGL